MPNLSAELPYNPQTGQAVNEPAAPEPMVRSEALKAVLEQTALAQKMVFQYNHEGWYVGPGISRESPREPGVFISPQNSVEVQPPTEVAPGCWPRWNGHVWLMARPEERDDKRTVMQTIRDFLRNNPLLQYLIK